ncbi:hypothetical protein BH23PLA1_BH23PLA1_04710 [soil metagenome]
MKMLRFLGLMILLASPTARAGLDPERLSRIDGAVEQAIEAGQVPGAVVIVGQKNEIAYAKAFGHRAIEPEAEPLTRDTVFDMASLTKPIATATAVMLLVEQGKIRLDASITEYLPELDNQGKDAITIDHLLRHRAGLIPDNPLSDYAGDPETSWKNIAEIDLQAEPGERFRYTDVGFMILGKLVERVSGQSLDEFTREHIFEPIGMMDTGFLPVDGKGFEVPADRIAPTEKHQGEMLRGHVHDPRARALGGVAGHAGLFGKADDLAIYAQTLLNGGLAPNGQRLFAPLTVRAMIDPGDTPNRERRGLGWDVSTGYSSPRGDLFGPRSFGHTGFTGTSIWIDPETETFVVILTSRLHPDGKAPAPSALRRKVATIAASAVSTAPLIPEEPAVREVKCGIDVLIEHEFEGLKGKRVGLVTNHTGLTRAGRSTIDALFEAEGVELVALFSPEHGIRGQLDTRVGDSTDEQTGLPIFSLYGETRKPTPKSLEKVDVLVYDIQDIGTRFYTYISTLGLVMEAAKEKGIPLVVLDRPNPIGGVLVAGPLREEEFASFIAFHEIPLVHGMTVGELARMFNTERKMEADLTVIPCEGWERADQYDRTGLLWVNPSPNMRSLTQALLYPGVGLLEATNLATGRGTDTPFERVGAPWIEPRAFAAALNEQRIPGLRFLPIHFTPTERQYTGEQCGGVFIMIIDREALDPIALGLGLASTLRELYPDAWKPDGLKRFLANNDAYQALIEGNPPEAIRDGWAEGLESFRQRRTRYLLYGSF